jgi:NAD(P)-dependent dehydrogenase (short-subunit alcohol dehydrogenase family)
MKLKNKIALITGGSRGIGEAIAKRFIEEGAKVIVFGIEKPKYPCEFCEVDVSNEEMIRNGISKLKKVDILVNNAGIYLSENVANTITENLDKILNVNLRGTYLMCKYALPLIKKSKGNILNISSGLALVAEPESPAYCVSKAGVVMLTKCLALEMAKQGVRVNAILPGPIDTPLLRNAFPSKKEFKEYLAANPLGRAGVAEEVANVALFLASDEASYVTGGMYTVDGGESLK